MQKTPRLLVLLATAVLVLACSLSLTQSPTATPQLSTLDTLVGSITTH